MAEKNSSRVVSTPCSSSTKSVAKKSTTALENLAQIICANAGARFIDVRAGQVFFSPDVTGDPPIESLPLSEFNSRNIRATLRHYTEAQ
jgi:hypothetical protein